MKKIKRLKRKLGCENGLFRVFLDDIVDGNGEVVRGFMVVAHKKKTKNLYTGVAVLPIWKGKFGLLRVYRHPLETFSWEAPRGFIDGKEGENVSALRELKEETGLVCSKKQLLPLGCTTPDGGIITAKIALFAATACRRVKKYKPTEFGHDKIRFFNPTIVKKMIENSQIEDAATLLAYYRYHHKLRRSF